MIQKTTSSDPIIDEIHRTRQQMTEKFGGDIAAILDDAWKRQEASGRTIWQRPPSNKAELEATVRSQEQPRATEVGSQADFLADRITIEADKCGGCPCIRGMRIRVNDVLDLLANGLSPEEIVEELPDLEAADIQACLRFASRRVAHREPVA